MFRRRLFRSLRYLICVVALGVGPTAATSQVGEARLSLIEARQLARQAVLTGDLALADGLSSALLAQDPDDPDALMVQAFVLRSRGDLDAAAAAAARAHRLAETPALRFDAAMLVADIKARQERYTSSQIWLRRADQQATTDPQRQVAANAYRQVTRLNPLAIQLRFSARPTNNVNNGAETTVIEIGGLPFVLDPSGQQLGGFEASTGLSLSYRLDEEATRRTDLVAELYYRKIWLDSAAQAAAPGAEGADFDYGVVIAGLRERRLIWPEWGVSQATVLLGQSWYGGNGLARWGELQLGQTVSRGATSSFNFGAVLRSEKRLDDDINSSESLAFSVDWNSELDKGAYSIGAAVKNVWSDSATVDQTSVLLRASRSFDDIAGLRPTITGSIEQRLYHEFVSSSDGRTDVAISLGLDVTWPEVTFYGFSPRVSLNARRTYSNVDIYDRNEYSLGVTAVSRF